MRNAFGNQGHAAKDDEDGEQRAGGADHGAGGEEVTGEVEHLEVDGGEKGVGHWGSECVIFDFRFSIFDLGLRGQSDALQLPPMRKGLQSTLKPYSWPIQGQTGFQGFLSQKVSRGCRKLR